MAAVEHDRRGEDTRAHRPGKRRPGRGPVATVVSVLGELLMTAGVVLGLFVVYSLWWTNLLADRAADQESDRIREQWEQEIEGAGVPGKLDTRDGIGFLHVPAMDDDQILIKKGTDPKVLDDGAAGYYTDPIKATLPTSGKNGNFSLAAHRDGHGAKFHDIHKIREGDPIVFESKDKWYVYKVFEILPQTSRFNVGVLEGVPKESGRDKPGKYITLTTCTPMYTSEHRYIVWGELVRVEPVDERRTPPREIRAS
ncbi:class E sortase [Streptomyces sp. NPDC005012]|uniref:class E sortase n=1 Tax=unclassified Streptomyces TaxID=2593676 RepID=UPI0033AE70BB